MGDTNIEWTQQTWNPVAGCLIKSKGCARCYAMRMAARLQAMGKAKYAGTTMTVNGKAVWTGKLNLDDASLQIPFNRQKPTMWFVNSMSDLFYGDDDDRKKCEGGRYAFEPIPFEFIDRVFAVMALTPQHTYQILTKRPARMAEYLNQKDSPLDSDNGRRDIIAAVAIHVGKIVWDPRGSVDANYRDVPGYKAGDGANRRVWPGWPLPNVWLGTSIENQKAADERIPELARCPAAVRFLSVEPLLEAISLPLAGHGIDWVIVGGESGPNARPCSVQWVRSIIEQCDRAGVPVFCKQLGANVIEPRVTGARDGTLPTLTAGWPEGTRILTYCEPRPPNAWRPGEVRLKDRKGGTVEEWPADLRRREFPSLSRQRPPQPAAKGGTL